jgi:hypothetical protein
VIGEGFIDHQSGIANARARSADAVMGTQWDKGTKRNTRKQSGAPPRGAI